MALPLVPLAVAAGVCAIWRARPSTIIRVVEDVIVDSSVAVARSAKRTTRSVRLEYNARLINKLQEKIAVEAIHLRSMPEDERAALAAEQAAIFRRAEELRAQRAAKQARKEAKRKPRYYAQRDLNERAQAYNAEH